MHPIQPAIDLPRPRVSRGVAYVALAALLLSPNLSSVQTRPSTGVLDLTAISPAKEQGYPGIPGMNVGGSTGPATPSESLAYPLPLELSILGSSFDNERNFVIELLLRNTGQTTFRLPSSRNLTKIERTGNKSQHIFFFLLRPVTRESSGPEFITSVATGGSASVPGSFTDLGPGESLRVRVPAVADEVRNTFTQKT